MVPFTRSAMVMLSKKPFTSASSFRHMGRVLQLFSLGQIDASSARQEMLARLPSEARRTWPTVYSSGARSRR